MDSTNTLDLISVSVGEKEVSANALLAAAYPVMAFARKDADTTALTWGYYGVPRWKINGVAVSKANSSILLTASLTRYLSVDRTLAVSEASTAFAPDKLALYKIVTGSATITSHEDHRDPHHINRFLYGRFTLAMADANQTLTYEQAMCESMELTGALTALRDVIVPLVPRDWKIYANTSGGHGVRVIAASGTGITIADGKRAIVECDGTNIVRITADV